MSWQKSLILAQVLASIIYGILAEIRFLEEPAPLRLPEGGSGTFRCRVDLSRLSSPLTASNFKWVLNSRYIKGTYDPATGSYILTITGADSSMQGNYSCRVSNDEEFLDSRPAPFILLVKPQPPIIRITPGDGLIAGTLLDITCSSAGGQPSPYIEILKNDVPLLLENGSQPVAKTSEGLETSLHMLINLSRLDDGANISCLVKHETLQSPMRVDLPKALDVKYSPKIILKPAQTYSVEVHKKMEVSCWSIANPAADEMIWTYKSQSTGSYAMPRVPRPADYENSNLSPTAFPSPVTRIHDLIIDSVERNRGGTYTCRANNGIAMTQSELTVNVLYEPIATSTPEVYVKEGDDLNITCNVDSNPPPFKVTWVKKEREISMNYISTSRTLYVPNVKRDFTASYKCRAENRLEPTGGTRIHRAGEAITKVFVEYSPGQATIRIDGANGKTPALSQASADLESGQGIVMLGDSFELICDTGSSPGIPAPKFRWLKARHPDRRSGLVGESLEEIRHTSSRFKISGATLKDGGNYYCSAHNKHGEGAKAKYQLVINAPPKVVASLASEYVVNATKLDFALHCSFTGKPAPSVTWYHNDKLIASTNPDPLTSTMGRPDSGEYRYKLTYGASPPIAQAFPQPSHNTNLQARQEESSPFAIKTDVGSYGDLFEVTSTLAWRDKVEPEDRGFYKCLAQLTADPQQTTTPMEENIIGNGISSSYTASSQTTLKIKHQPIADSNYTTFKAAFDYGQPATLRCAMWANPEPRFMWRFGTRILSPEDPKYSITSSARMLNGNTLYEGILQIQEFTTTDVGTYLCLNENLMGFSEYGLQLQAKGKPDTPTQIEVTYITHNSISLSWLPGFDGGAPQAFKLFYRLESTIANTFEDLTSSHTNRIVDKRHSSFSPRAYDPSTQPDNTVPFGNVSENIAGYVNEGPQVRPEFYAGAIEVPLDQGILHPGSDRPSYVLNDLKARHSYLLWMQSQNVYGSSEPSKSYIITTAAKRIGPESIPAPSSVVYWVHNDTLNFYVTQLDGLCAKLVYDDPSSGYDTLGCYPLSQYTLPTVYGYDTEPALIDIPLSEILSRQQRDHEKPRTFSNGGRFVVQLCADYDNTLCGPKEFSIYENRPSSQMTKSKKSMQSLTVVATLIPLLLILAMVSAVTFVCLRRNRDKGKKDYELKASSDRNRANGNGYRNDQKMQQPPYYTTASDPSKAGSAPSANGGGFINRGMEMEDGSSGMVMMGHETSRHFPNHNSPPPYNGNGLYYPDPGTNRSESTPKGGQNGSLPYTKTVQRFRTPQDLLLAASMEDDNDLGYHQTVLEEDEQEISSTPPQQQYNTRPQQPIYPPHHTLTDNHHRAELDRSYDDSSIPINASETDSQRIMHEVIV